MRGKRSSSNLPSNNYEVSTECMVNPSVPQMKPGDIVWGRIIGGSWWPVQVVDEKCVARKPKKKNNEQVLVRVYGTFEHLYLEPGNCVLNFENVYGQENCSSKEVFKKALEEGLARMISSCRSKRRFCESKENEKDEAPRGKSRKKGKLKRTHVGDSPEVVFSDNQNVAEKIEVVIVDDMDDAVQASADGLAKRDEMKSSVLKRRTRSETFKARNAGKSVVEVSNEAENAINEPSIINSLDKKDSMNLRHKGAEEKVTANIHDKTSESKCVKQDNGCSMKQNVWSEFSDIKNIKRFVAKIVKEVAAEKAIVKELAAEKAIVKELAAEKAQNEALEGRAVQGCPENTKCMESSRKDISVSNHMNKCSPRSVKDKDNEVLLTKGNTDDPTQDEIAVLSGVGKPNMAEKVGIGASRDKILRQYNLRKREFVSANNGISKDTRVDACGSKARKQGVIDMSNFAEQAKKETQVKQGGVEHSRGTEMARNGGTSYKVIKKDASRKLMESHDSTKIKVLEEQEDLSLRSTRVKQTLGLIAPPGSPFSKIG